MRAVLFDLDGTLLDLDLGAFLGRYFDALEALAHPLVGAGREGAFMRALHDAVREMMSSHIGRTNEEVFADALERSTGLNIQAAWPHFERFYREDFPLLADSAHPAPGARLVVATARDLGFRIAIATNPIFPRAAIEHRLSWAGVSPGDVDVITSYEVMEATKPWPAYFRQTAALLDVAPSECLMVGDDRSLDLAAADVGMRTYYVGSDSDAPAHYSGDLPALAELLPALL